MQRTLEEIMKIISYNGVMQDHLDVGLLGIAAISQFPADQGRYETDWSKLVSRAQKESIIVEDDELQCPLRLPSGRVISQQNGKTVIYGKKRRLEESKTKTETKTVKK